MILQPCALLWKHGTHLMRFLSVNIWWHTQGGVLAVAATVLEIALALVVAVLTIIVSYNSFAVVPRTIIPFYDRKP